MIQKLCEGINYEASEEKKVILKEPDSKEKNVFLKELYSKDQPIPKWEPK
jgi:hypothetical protein